jgi:phosphoesterase RecJ-like protein
LVGAGLVAEAIGAEVVYFTVGPIPDNLRWLPRADRLVSALPAGWTPDVTILVDCASRDRAGATFPGGGWGKTVVCIDHHATFDADVADVFIHDVSAAASGELVLALADEAGVPLSVELAEALYCAIMTDTGCFRYGSTTAETLETGARLLRAGVKPWRVASAVYESEPLERLTLMRMVLDTLTLSADGRLATIVITDAMLAESGADITMTDGMINLARSVRGVEVAAQLTERSDGRYRVGLRSRGNIDVSAVAARLGGGGHRNAAGFTADGSLDDVRERLAQVLGALVASR